MKYHPQLFRAILLPALLFLGLADAALAASLSPSSQSVSGTVGKAITPTAAFTATGFTGTVTYALSASSPKLPANLNLNPNTGVISGIPNSTLAATKFTVLGKGATSGQATAEITVTIKAAPAALSPATQSVVSNKDADFPPTTAFTASNFGGTVSYSVSPALPLGLKISSATGVISGYPRVPLSATAFTVTAKGSTSGTATAKVSIGILENCITPVLSAAEEGRRAYLRLNCNVCHGGNGHGATMAPSIAGKELGDIQEAMIYGKDGGMPSFKNYICGNDAANIAAYLQTLGRSNEPKFLNWWEPNPSH